MPQTIAEVMTRDPVTLDTTASIVDAAHAMKDRDIGDVVVCDNGRICGIVTDRVLVVRALADGKASGTVNLRGYL
jgi:CBS domain-containing protein